MDVPAAEIAIDEPLVRRLLAAQHPDLAELPLRPAGKGWDNDMWRVGDELAVRLPRRAAAMPLVELEHRWLPMLAVGLPVAAPVPVRVGVPGEGFPWPWSIVPWIEGETADIRVLSVAGYGTLGHALSALHRPSPPDDAPVSAHRGIELADRPDPMPALEAYYEGDVPRQIARIWRRAVGAGPAPVRTWIHGDPHVRNMLVGDDGDLSGMLDWGDLGIGDPAVDLSVLWTVMEAAGHLPFCAAYGPVEGPLLDRARGWALAFGALFVSMTEDEDAVAIGSRVLGRLVG